MSKKMYKIFHYRKKCIGCNTCVELAFNRWRISKKDGKAVLIGAKHKKGVYVVDINFDEYEKNLKAAKDCPSRCIKIQNYLGFS